MSAGLVSGAVTAFWCVGAFVSVFFLSAWPKRVAIGSLIAGIALLIFYGSGILAYDMLNGAVQVLFEIVGRFEGGNILYVIGSGLFGSFMSRKYTDK